jgi:hypothetical protein
MRYELKTLAWMVPVGFGVWVLMLLMHSLFFSDTDDAAAAAPAPAVSAPAECGALDAGCLAEKAAAVQAEQAQQGTQALCRTAHDDSYTCALPTESGTVYATTPSTCDWTPAGLNVFSVARALTECTGDAQEAVRTVAASYGVTEWDGSPWPQDMAPR